MVETLDLARRLAKAGNLQAAPLHALHRLKVLLGDEEVQYIDGRFDVDQRAYTGRIVVLTAKLVLVLDLEKSEAPDQHAAPTSTISIVAWSRATLRSIELAPSENPLRNPDQAWADDYGEYWPPEAQVDLKYSGGEVLSLPLCDIPEPEHRVALKSLVPSLLRDLAV